MRRQQQQKAAVPLNLGNNNNGAERKKPWWFDDNRNSPQSSEKDRAPKDKDREGVSLFLHTRRMAMRKSSSSPLILLCKLFPLPLTGETL